MGCMGYMRYMGYVCFQVASRLRRSVRASDVKSEGLMEKSSIANLHEQTQIGRKQPLGLPDPSLHRHPCRNEARSLHAKKCKLKL